jgi:hypothetical protein
MPRDAPATPVTRRGPACKLRHAQRETAGRGPTSNRNLPAAAALAGRRYRADRCTTTYAILNAGANTAAFGIVPP